MNNFYHKTSFLKHFRELLKIGNIRRDSSKLKVFKVKSFLLKTENDN